MLLRLADDPFTSPRYFVLSITFFDIPMSHKLVIPRNEGSPQVAPQSKALIFVDPAAGIPTTVLLLLCRIVLRRSLVPRDDKSGVNRDV